MLPFSTRHVPRRRALPNDIGEELKDLQRKLSHVSLEHEKGFTEDTGVDEDAIENLLPLHENQIKQALYSDVADYHLRAIIKLRKFLCLDEVIEKTQRFLALNILDRLIFFLKDPNSSRELQYETCWILTNVSAGLTEHTLVIVNAGFVPVLIDLLSCGSGSVRSQAAWTLGNIAGENSLLRDSVINAGILEPLLQIWHCKFDDDFKKRSALHVAIWVFANLCRWKRPDWTQLCKAFPIILQVINYNDDEIVSEACWALSRIFHSKHEVIDELIRSGVVDKLVQLLESPKPSILNPVLRALTNIASGSDDQTQLIINAGVLPRIKPILYKQSFSVRQEALMVISNIAAGTRNQVQSLIDGEVMADVLVIMSDEINMGLKKEACWVLSNATSVKDYDQIRYLVNAGVYVTVLQFLGQTLDDYQAMQKALECLGNIFTAGGEDANTNPFVKYLRDSHKLDEFLRFAQVAANGADQPNDELDYEWYSDYNQAPSTPKERVLHLFVCLLQRWFGKDMDERVMYQGILSGVAGVSLG
ncbi:Importin alpha subunit (Karyopherin alpha subunit) (Serine-rich RNA polymerase I suppressor protein) [Nowakowskiella sp. JEL0407]|nr:Importin alpha subunit (Karyopherin alpha subunit) (Serine-rich RNA polymerase I suppressor protein) [Nowakowskiella sp. JEL0407]